MIAVDANILVYAHQQLSPWYGPASEALVELAEGSARWAIPWPCIHEFLAVVSNPRISQRTSGLKDALQQVEYWMESPSLVLIGEDADHWPTLRELLDSGDVVGGMVHDARIAAICLRHGVSEFWTADRDFGRFPSLKTRNPLALT